MIDAEYMREIYRKKADLRMGCYPEDWQPELGFRANRAPMHQVYYAYQSLYQARPAQFLWAGLARLTGGQVLYGLKNLARIARDPCVMTREIVAIARDIYQNLGWQHELFLDSPDDLIACCKIFDAQTPHLHPYADCWALIEHGDRLQVALGNRMLLENEQHNTVQPHYERIRQDAYSRPYFWLTRLVMRNIHPFHRRFLFDQGLRDVTVFRNRWRWIGRPGGMWDRWAGAAQRERDYLVGLSNEAVTGQAWGKIFR
jgi:hypothetical protein